jgi:hypothetical protein
VSAGDREGPPVGEEPGDLMFFVLLGAEGVLPVGGSGQTDFPRAPTTSVAALAFPRS